jgi:glucosamine--fructose-6-phosphate aminotransferase (isomerizing)
LKIKVDKMNYYKSSISGNLKFMRGVFYNLMRNCFTRILYYLSARVYFGKYHSNVPCRSLIFFPFRENLFCCGLAGIVSFKKEKKPVGKIDVSYIEESVKKIEARSFINCVKNGYPVDENYLCGKEAVESLLENVRELKRDAHFFNIYKSEEDQEKLKSLFKRIDDITESESKILSEKMGQLEPSSVDVMSGRIETLKDVSWCLSIEIILNISRIKELVGVPEKSPSFTTVTIYKNVNAVLNSIDRLEVRGRDSAGISLMFVIDDKEYAGFEKSLKDEKLSDVLKERTCGEILLNGGITINRTKEKNGVSSVSLAFVYKVAAEIGSLGDNIAFLRSQIKNDRILRILSLFPNRYHTVSSHTRWASVGAITEANCHPIDGRTKGACVQTNGIIHVCLNGDIDNYLELKKEYESSGNLIHTEVTTDTKIIPLQIEKYLNRGFEVEEAFRLAVNDFEGSHAISMHTDLDPGKFFLAQRGSGQAVFVGIGKDHYIPASEVYGLIEETPYYLKMEGEKTIEGKNGGAQGQIFILDQQSGGGISGIKAMFYDKTPVHLQEKDIKHTNITSRDIDRQNYTHYFLKEISESPASVEKTLQNRWKTGSDGKTLSVFLSEKEFPESLKKAFRENGIRRIYFIGQGTAGVAALVCSDILNYYLNDTSINVSSHKASELSGFRIDRNENPSGMSDALVVAITQSGTTTDTNRAVEMVKKRGAYTIAIVNRRDSDITFKVDGVIYTSSGRDIEMSVASTKAFYCQIVAGAVLNLFIAGLLKRRNDEFISEEIKSLRALPSQMRKVLLLRDRIEDSARRLAVTKTYWAAVGSGPNKASSDEIRIKLSELCYKTISSDYIEDKKHIDLSSEPLIIVCAAGARDNVIGDIIKDTAIFKAHKATPVVIADEGEERFAPYAEDVFFVPVVGQHLAPVLNTLAGHIWGYYAALSINECSRFMYNFRDEIETAINERQKNGIDIYEFILEKSFREKIARFYNEFRRRKNENRFPAVIGLDSSSNLILLCKYISGKLPVSDFELDFGLKGTAVNMINTLIRFLGESINYLSRPIDAIKHQAKTVTVGTSRISEKLYGTLFDAINDHGLSHSQLTNMNILVLKNLQEIVSEIKGSILYRISGLSLLGEITEETKIEIIKKEGVLKPIPSRVETDHQLKGTKKIIVRQGNVYIGKGRKDDRSIIIIPALSSSPMTPNTIEHLLLLNISFREGVHLNLKIKALGGKYDNIKSIVQENSLTWDDNYLDRIDIKELFGVSAEKIAESIVSKEAAR